MELQTAWIRHGLLRIVLPLFLLFACIVRYNLFSCVYGLLMLVGALVPGLNAGSVKGKTGYYLIAVVMWSSIALLGQVVFQITIFATGAYEKEIFANCSYTESLLRQIGFPKLELNHIGSILRITLPDVVMVIVSVTVLVVCHKLVPKRRMHSSVHHGKAWQSGSKLFKTSAKILSYFGEFLVTLFLAASGIMHPSLLSSVYFLSFLGLASWWACYNTLGKKYSIFRIIMMVYSGAHFIVLYLYQFQFFQEFLPPQEWLPRALGLTAIIKTDCSQPWEVTTWSTLTWPIFVSPIMILILYNILAWEIRYEWAKKEQHTRRKKRIAAASERQSLVNSEQQPASYNSMDATHSSSPHHHRHRHLQKDATSSSTIEEEPSQPPHSDDEDNRRPIHTDEEAPQTHSEEEENMDKDGKRNVNINNESENQSIEQRGTFTSIFVFIMKQSYVATLIVMMAWSITYHSWLTFVFLLWACIIWCTPKQRTVCLSCAPLIVIYAEGLLIAQYVWSFNLRDIFPLYTRSGFPYSEIGLEPFDYPAIHLAVQSVYTVMFWITLRQDMREKKMTKELEEAQSGVPLVKVENKRLSSTSSRRGTDIVDGFDSDNIKEVGKFLWHLLCKYWIFVCAALFLSMAVQEAVIYRIIYMVMFLCFLLAFQISYRFWRFFVYAFWWVVIMYSMIVLILIYTYQFKNFPEYWQNGTGLSNEVFEDIGLKKADTAQLFLNLLTPTSFLIVIILQIHFFQKPFLILSDLNRYRSNATLQLYNDIGSITIPNSDESSDEETQEEEELEPKPEASPKVGKADNRSVHNNLQETENDKEEDASTVYESAESRTLREKISYFSSIAWQEGYGWLDKTSTLFWRIAEVHFYKIVTLTIWICIVTEVSMISVVLLFVVVICLPIVHFYNLLCHMCMIWASIVILAKMLFQLQIIDQKYWYTNCTSSGNLTLESPFNETISNADYLGLEKTDNLALYLRNYLALVIVISLWSIIKIHQQQHYSKPDVVRPPKGMIFVGATRQNADEGLWPCFKYFVNFGFYKFGLEICYTMTIITMAVRLDVFSVIYGIMVAFLLALNRKNNARVWPLYILILSILIPIQYLSALGLPPGLCWQYPWKDLLELNLRIYLYIPNYTIPPDAMNLIADFFQLGFAFLQLKVFDIEKNQLPDEEYPGGDNDEISDQRKFPLEDFLTCKDCYLDYVKAAVFGYMFWATLVVVFIAGTSRISIFAMGYLVACFFFFWHDQELLVAPLPRLLRLWNTLLGYNFTVILLKCGIQLIGCVYVGSLLKDACWVVQLFSILCLRARHYEIVNHPVDDNCQVEKDSAGLLYDCICFGFLLMQIRIYKSHYFQNVVNELILSEKLASRGAELINGRMIRQVAEMKEKEHRVLKKIKAKMEKIKLRQAKLHDNRVLNTEDHYIVIRSGDYYMFQEDSDDDSETDTVITAPEVEEEEDRVDPILLIDTAIMGGTKKALHSAKLQRQGSVSRNELTQYPDGHDVRKRRSTLSEVGSLHTAKSAATRTSERRYSLSDTPTSKENLDLQTAKSVVEAPQLKPISEAISDEHEQQLEDFETPIHKTESIRDIEAEISKDEDDEKHEENFCSKVANAFRLILEILGGLLDYLIVYLNRLSRQYRIVARTLAKEKLIEKEKMHIAMGEYHTTEQVEQPTIRVELEDEMDKEDEMITEFVEHDKENEFRRKTPRVFQLIVALYDVFVSHSDMVCYLAMCINHLVTGSLLSLIFPLSVFLWALLMVPRVSKIYWITAITYTEAVVVVKYIFQFRFIALTESGALEGHSNDPLSLPYIIGITRQDHYALYDLLLLFCLFFHRSVLKKYGLWKDAEEANQDFDKAIYASHDPTPASTPAKEKANVGFAMDERNNITDEEEDKSLLSVVRDKDKKTVTYNVSDENFSIFSEEPDRRMTQSSYSESRGGESSSTGGEDQDSTLNLFEACCQPFRNFYKQLTDPRYNYTEDVYVPMFLCDFFNFCVIVFGYYSFGPKSSISGSVASVLVQNTVPVPFIVMLLIQFLIIIVDRAIYLRKNIFAKLIFHFILVIFMHVWLFFLLPWITYTRFTDNIAAMIFYFVKCISFIFAARQVRSGYPTRILGNFLTKKYNYVNLFLFKGFLVIPFLLEVRSVMDWMWTDSTLGLTHWLQMEDIYANIYVLKCWRWAENTYVTKRGLKRDAWIKYSLGGILLTLLIILIWFPLLLFSLGSAVFEANPPVKCHVQVTVGHNKPLFEMNVQDENIQQITDGNYTDLLKAYPPNSEASGFLSSFEQSDIYVLHIQGASLGDWSISPPSRRVLINDLNDPTLEMNLNFRIAISRAGGRLNEVVIAATFKTKLEGKSRIALARMIAGELVNSEIYEDAFPRFIHVASTSQPMPVDALKLYPTNLTTTLKANGTDVWWELAEQTTQDIYNPYSPNYAWIKPYLTIITFNDRVVPESLSFIASYGIFGLYVSVIFVVAGFVRVYFSGYSYRIAKEELPNVDKLSNLCLEIYMARECKEYHLEEELFARLVYLYRSSESLVNYTKHKLA